LTNVSEVLTASIIRVMPGAIAQKTVVFRFEKSTIPVL
jgi:hypothetical protein